SQIIVDRLSIGACGHPHGMARPRARRRPQTVERSINGPLWSTRVLHLRASAAIAPGGGDIIGRGLPYPRAQDINAEDHATEERADTLHSLCTVCHLEPPRSGPSAFPPWGSPFLSGGQQTHPKRHSKETSRSKRSHFLPPFGTQRSSETETEPTPPLLSLSLALSLSLSL